MSDEFFAQRRPVNLPNPPEVEDTTPEEEYIPQPSELRQENIAASADETALQISGNLPLELQQMIANKKKDVGGSSLQPRVKQKNELKQEDRNPESLPSARSKPQRKGSDNYESLLQKLKNKTQIADSITLPSLGRFYNGEDGPTDGELIITQMTGHHESILATYHLSKKGLAMDMIFDDCIKGKYLSRDLLTVDRTYLMIYLRAWSFSPEYQVELKCPFTDRTFTETIDLVNDIEVIYCPEGYNETSLYDELPTTQIPFTYRLSRGRDEQNAKHFQEMRNKRTQGTSKPDETLHHRMAQLITDFGGVEDPDEIRMLLEQLPIGDVAYLRNVVTDPPFGVDTTLTIISPYANEEFEIELPLSSSFFFPQMKKAT